MSENHYVIASGDDWSGLYINGVLKSEGHSFSTEHVLEIAIEAPPTSVKSVEVDYDWLDDRGNLPDKLEECKLQ